MPSVLCSLLIRCIHSLQSEQVVLKPHHTQGGKATVCQCGISKPSPVQSKCSEIIIFWFKVAEAEMNEQKLEPYSQGILVTEEHREQDNRMGQWAKV